MPTFQPPKFLRGLEKSVIRQISDRAQPGSIALGLGEPDLPTPEVIRRAAIEIIQNEQSGYTLQAGLPALRALVAEDYPQLNLSPEEVIITAGSQEAMYLALMTLIETGDEVLMPDPGFVAYPTITRMAGGKEIYYRLPARNSFGFDADDFARCVNDKTKVVICTSPSNPTGRTFSVAELQKMAEILKQKNPSAFVISDEIYRELYYTPERPASISEFYPRTIVISGLSKSMSMTGWRLGWMCGDQDVIAAALVLHGYVTTCASAISQKAALASWTAEGEAARAHTRKIFAARREHLIGLFAKELDLHAVAPEGAFYTMLDVRPFGNSMEIAEQFLEQRVVTIPGSAFGKEGEGFLRVSFCADLPVLTEGVARMKAALENRPGKLKNK